MQKSHNEVKKFLKRFLTKEEFKTLEFIHQTKHTAVKFEVDGEEHIKTLSHNMRDCRTLQNFQAQIRRLRK